MFHPEALAKSRGFFVSAFPRCSPVGNVAGPFPPLGVPAATSSPVNPHRTNSPSQPSCGDGHPCEATMLPTANQIAAAVGCASSTAKRFEKPLRDTCARFSIDTVKRLAAFLAQVGHESDGLSRTVENLNYSAQGLLRTWPSRFDERTAREFGRQPERIANKVYGGRLGNSAPGDGWKYRGRGLIQVTGKANYEAITELMMGLTPPDAVPDFVLQPELLEQPQWAAMSAGAFWHDHELNDLADRGEMDRMTRVINGGSNGLADRKVRYARALQVLG